MATKTKKTLILAASEKLDVESLGAHEIEQIQAELIEEIGTSESPALIARTLADHGVRLRHPEILELDRRWREQNLYSLFAPEEMDFRSLDSSVTSVRRITDLFEVFQDENDSVSAKMVTDFVVKLRTELHQMAVASLISEEARSLATEVSEWLLVWLESPALFADWLTLRFASPDFIRKFSECQNRER